MVIDGRITDIPVLELLSVKQTYENIPVSQAITGTITIDVSAAADEFALYSKYHSLYPNLTIKYSNKVALSKAYNITFYSQDKADVDDEDMDLDVTTPHFEVVTNGTYTLETLISKTGPANKDMSMPIKAPTAREVFNFTGVWVDYLDNNQTEYYVDSYFTDVSPHWDADKKARLFSAYTPTKDMRLVPVFAVENRSYAIHFYNNNAIEFSAYLGFEDVVGEKVEDPRMYYLYRPDDDTLGPHERYAFRGWKSEK